MQPENAPTPPPATVEEEVCYVEDVDGDDFTFYLSAGPNAELLPKPVSHEDGPGASRKVRFSYARPLTVVESPLLKAADVESGEEFVSRLGEVLEGGGVLGVVLGEFREELRGEPPEDLLGRVLDRLNAWLSDETEQAPEGVVVQSAFGESDQAALQRFPERARRACLKRRYLDGQFEGRLKPFRLSLRRGRSIISRSYRGQLLSVSFRAKESGTSYEPDASPPGKYPLNMEDYCRVLYGALSEVKGTQGLLVIAGATNSSKSEIATGLIHKYLEAMKEQRKKEKKGRPHLVTFEDPIEKFYAGGALAERPRHFSVETAAAAVPFEVDYTPRERGGSDEPGKDVESLDEALADALRQTPSVFFVGETRDKTFWRPLVDFAGTGHLIVTTAHAGSLSEAMHKIFEALKVRTPAERSEIANRLLGVVHVNRHGNVLVPALWRRTPTGKNALTAEGLSSLLPYAPKHDEGDDCKKGCLGRFWFAERLLDKKDVPGKQEILSAAVRWDLEGV